jgi:ABC-type transporter Mla subunit MlaD
VIDSLADRALARRVGALAIAAIAVAIAGFVFLLDRAALGSPTRIRVTFRHTAGLREHAALVVAGRPIGRVEAIAPIPHGGAGTLEGEVGVAVTVAIDEDSAWKVPARAEIFISSRGPVSDKYLEVAPPRGDPGPPIHDGQELRGIDPPSLDSVLQRTWRNLTTFRDFVDAVQPELTVLRTQLAELRTRLDALSADTSATGGIDTLVAATRELVAAARHTRDVSLGGDAGLAHLRATLDDTRATLAQLRATIDLLAPRVAAVSADLTRIRGHLAASAPIARIEQTLASARATLDKLEPLLAGIDTVRQRIADGEGSLLRVIRDPEFPEDAKDIGKVIKRHPWRILDHARE